MAMGGGVASAQAFFPPSGWNAWEKGGSPSSQCKICRSLTATGGGSWTCSKCESSICCKCVSGGTREAWMNLLAQDNFFRCCHCQHHNIGGMRPDLLNEAREKGISIPLLAPLGKEFMHRQQQGRREERRKKEKVVVGQNLEVGGGNEKNDAAEKRKAATGHAVPDASSAQKKWQMRFHGDDERNNTDIAQNLTHKPHHMDGGTAIIVGAGIIGLSVARELALAAKNSKIKHDIVVIDVRDKPCTLASDACAGILNGRNTPKEIDGLVDIASNGWNEMMQYPGFADTVSYRNTESVHIISSIIGDGQEKAPSWHQTDAKDTFATDYEETMGKVNTTVYISWLCAECRRLGVKFLFNSAIVEVRSKSGPEITSDISFVQVLNLVTHSIGDLPCSNLVLAAGPWTTQIFNGLYPRNQMRLENHVRCVPWYRMTDDTSTSNDVALIHTSSASSATGFEPEIIMAAQSKKNSVTITAVPKDVRNGDMNANEATDPTANDATIRNILALKKAAATRIPGGTGRLEASTVGYSYVSTASASGCPIIGKVDGAKLGKTRFHHMKKGKGAKGVECGEEEEEKPNGVWLCYGFGMYGTSLAPGVAKKLVLQKMMAKNGIIEEHVLARPVGKLVVPGSGI